MTRHQGVRAEHQVEQCGAWEKSPNSWEILVQAGLSGGECDNLGDNALLHQVIGKLDNRKKWSQITMSESSKNLNFHSNDQ